MSEDFLELGDELSDVNPGPSVDVRWILTGKY
jgi:hypothetical protein